MLQQRVPDTLSHVVVVKWLTQPVAKYELAEHSGGLVLGLERIVHRAKHGNFPLRAICFGVPGLAMNEGFSHQDFPFVEIHMLPLEAVNLPRSHAGVETYQVIFVVILSDRFEDLFYLVQGEGLDVYLLLFQRFDVQLGIGEVKPFSRLRQNHPQNGHVAVDGFGCHPTTRPLPFRRAILLRAARMSGLEILPTRLSLKAGFRVLARMDSTRKSRTSLKDLKENSDADFWVWGPAQIPRAPRRPTAKSETGPEYPDRKLARTGHGENFRIKKQKRQTSNLLICLSFIW